MLRSYRGIVIALAGLAFLCGVYSPDEGRAAHGSAQNTSQQIGEAINVEASVEAPRSPTPVQHLTSAARDEAYYNREDLNAQQGMAKWTRIMGIAAIVGVALSAIGVGLVYSTFIQAKRAADAGFQSVQHSEKAMRQLTRTSRQELRAYIVVSEASYRIETMSGPPVAEIRIVNAGQTPAYDLCAIGVVRFAEKAPTNIRFDLRDEPRFIVGRDLDLPIRVECDEGSNLEQAGTTKMFVAGEIRYSDIFNQRWVQRFVLTQVGSYGRKQLTSAASGNSEKRWRA